MNKIVFALVAACALTVCAEEKVVAKPQPAGAEKAKSKLTDAEKAERRERMMKKTGGMVERKGDGKLVFVDCQDKIASDEVTRRVDKIRYVLKYNTELRKGSWKFNQPNPEDATVVVYIVNDASLPMSLVSVEARWGVVNTAMLDNGERFSKELTRVFAIVAGGALSQVKTAPLQPVSKVADLDKLVTDGFTFDMANAIFTNLGALGATTSKITTYRKACMEGWAAQPTNDYQKAIWEEVHAIPDRPIKIKK